MSRCVLSLRIIALVALPLGCSGEVDYSPERDAAVMQSILGTWTAPGAPITLTVCEDIEAAESEAAQRAPGNCQVDHVVRPGRGTAHSEDHSGVGCGGCPFSVHAFVTVELAHPDLPEPVVASGAVVIGDGYEDDPYSPPYRIEALVDGRYISAEIDGDGELRFTNMDGAGQLTVADMPRLELSDSAACP
jgi:hypothetical protein